MSVPAPEPKKPTLKLKKPILAPRRKKDISKDYKPKNITCAFDGNYIEHRSKCVEIVSIKQYFKNIRLYLPDMINDFKKSK